MSLKGAEVRQNYYEKTKTKENKEFDPKKALSELKNELLNNFSQANNISHEYIENFDKYTPKNENSKVEYSFKQIDKQKENEIKNEVINPTKAELSSLREEIIKQHPDYQFAA